MPYTGIDISGWQAGIPQSTINMADVVIVKATEGTGYVSPELDTQFRQGVVADKYVGVYHFARPGDAFAQAKYFVNTVLGRELYPDFWVLDFEDSALLPNQSWANDFMNAVSALTDQPVWFYCYMAPMKLYSYNQIRKNGYKHWIAGYPFGQQNGFGPKMSLDDYIVWSGLNSSGIDFAGWQYTSQGRLPGWAGDLDLNFFFDDAFPKGKVGLPGTETSSLTKPANDQSMERAIAWFQERLGKVYYSMDMTLRNGPNAYDCSSAVYTSLISAGVFPRGTRIGNTETLFDDLSRYGFERLGLNSFGSYDAERGDVFIWGDKGSSTGAAGHTGIFINADEIIHCNAGYNNITINNHDQIHAINGSPNVTIYRYIGDDNPLANFTEADLKRIVRDVLNEPINKAGGMKGTTSNNAETAWTHYHMATINKKLDNINQMVWMLLDTFRIGIPNIVKDGSNGGPIRKLFGYGTDAQAKQSPWGDLVTARSNRYKEAKKKNFPWWF